MKQKSKHPPVEIERRLFNRAVKMLQKMRDHRCHEIHYMEYHQDHEEHRTKQLKKLLQDLKLLIK